MDDAILLARSFWVDAERPVRWRAYAALVAILSLQVAKGKMAAVVSHAGSVPCSVRSRLRSRVFRMQRESSCLLCPRVGISVDSSSGTACC